MIGNNNNQNLGRILKQQRLMIPLTLRKLAAQTGISASHLGRIERGERYPSAMVLRRLAKSLGCRENELFYLAGYLSVTSDDTERGNPVYHGSLLDPYVGRALSQEPVEVQRTVIGILSILKSITRLPQ